MTPEVEQALIRLYAQRANEVWPPVEEPWPPPAPPMPEREGKRPEASVSPHGGIRGAVEDYFNNFDQGLGNVVDSMAGAWPEFLDDFSGIKGGADKLEEMVPWWDEALMAPLSPAMVVKRGIENYGPELPDLGWVVDRLSRISDYEPPPQEPPDWARPIPQNLDAGAELLPPPDYVAPPMRPYTPRTVPPVPVPGPAGSFAPRVGGFVGVPGQMPPVTDEYGNIPGGPSPQQAYDFRRPYLRSVDAYGSRERNVSGPDHGDRGRPASVQRARPAPDRRVPRPNLTRIEAARAELDDKLLMRRAVRSVVPPRPITTNLRRKML